MRLGRERPRKRLCLILSRPPGKASMRLGRERPRKAPRRRLRTGRRRGFNEAGARTPQKVKIQHACGCDSAGFNEAGARTPQKGPLPAPRVTPIPTASMRLGRERPRKRCDLHSGNRRERIASMRLGRERPRKADWPALAAALRALLQ